MDTLAEVMLLVENTVTYRVSIFQRWDTSDINYMIDLMPLEKDEMIRRCGLKYYPQIFINDEHIGGEEELLMLDHEGKLQALLNS